jgi:hypothetical protein
VIGRGGGAGLGRGLRLGLCLLAAPLLSCSGSVPEILAVEARVELRPVGGAASATGGGGGEAGAGVYESLSVFGNIRNADGLDDIEALWVVDDADELSWKLTDTNWSALSESGESWIGASGLTMVDYGAIPRGEYRLVVANLAGKRAEYKFRVSSGDRARPLPLLSQGDSRLSLGSDWPQNFLLAYDGAGALIASRPVGAGNIDLNASLGSENAQRAASLCVYGSDPAQLLGAYSWRMKRR